MVISEAGKKRSLERAQLHNTRDIKGDVKSEKLNKNIISVKEGEDGGGGSRLPERRPLTFKTGTPENLSSGEGEEKSTSEIKKSDRTSSRMKSEAR